MCAVSVVKSMFDTQAAVRRRCTWRQPSSALFSIPLWLSLKSNLPAALNNKPSIVCSVIRADPPVTTRTSLLLLCCSFTVWTQNFYCSFISRTYRGTVKTYWDWPPQPPNINTTHIKRQNILQVHFGEELRKIFLFDDTDDPLLVCKYSCHTVKVLYHKLKALYWKCNSSNRT